MKNAFQSYSNHMKNSTYGGIYVHKQNNIDMIFVPFMLFKVWHHKPIIVKFKWTKKNLRIENSVTIIAQKTKRWETYKEEIFLYNQIKLILISTRLCFLQ